MTGFIPKEKLTAYQRWEVAAFDEAEQAARKASAVAEATPARPPEPEQVPESPPVVLPTAADIERMYTEAQQQGYMAGYDEGIATARSEAAQIDALLTGVQQSISELDQQVAEQLLATAVGQFQVIVWFHRVSANRLPGGSVPHRFTPVLHHPAASK